MSLLAHLIARIVAIVVLCLAVVAGWVMIDAHRSVVAETRASAERVGQHLEAVYWNRLLWRDGMRKESILPIEEWTSLATLNLVAPGLCVTFAAPGDDARRLCAKVDMIGSASPQWFEVLNQSLFGTYQPLRRGLGRRDAASSVLYVSVDRHAAARLAWNQVSIVISVASLLAIAVAGLASLTIGHALMPARTIIDGLRRLQGGEHGWRLPAFRTAEFNHIARAVNALARQLGHTTAQRAALTARLFRVQEEERRAIARDLHDEFGQCLTATSALAALIEGKAAARHPDIADDARAISRAQQRMMVALRGTLARLRTQDIEEIGLEASLRQLVAECNSQSATPGVIKLNVTGRLTDIPKQIAIGIYRTAQECLTNALRHGVPSEVSLNVERSAQPDDRVAVTVEDDGGGDIQQLRSRTGHGLLGMRERITALGGEVAFSRARNGVRVAASVPLSPMALRRLGVAA